MDKVRRFIPFYLLAFLLFLAMPVDAQRKRKVVDEKVYLDHADELRYDQMTKAGVQIVKGNVRFRYQDTNLSCDSAYFNQDQNTFEAFGHVKMRKRGGITLDCDRAQYFGNSELIQARQHVVLKQPGRSLYCDSLDYNSGTEYANYFGGNGGKLIIGQNTVTSARGEYFMDRHEANFYENVVMKSPKYTINTEHLNYNTDTEEAHVIGPSVIHGKNGEVVNTNDGYYHSKTDRMELMGRSTIVSKERDVEGDHITYNSKTGDSEGDGNVRIVDKINDRVMTGDHLIYNEQTHVGEGNGNVVFVDRKNQNSLEGEYVHYTDSVAIAYGTPLVKEYSQKDTLFMRCDTIRMRAFNLDTDSVYREVYCYANVRAYRTDVQAVCDFLVFNSKDSCMTMHQDPIAWNGMRQILGDSIKIFMNDSTIREAYVFGNALSVEKVEDEDYFNQVSSKEMRAYFIDGKLRRNEAIGNVLSIYYPRNYKDSTYVGLNTMQTDTMRMYLTDERKLQKIWVSAPTGTLYPITQVPPGIDKLSSFAWYDFMRPLNKYDLLRRVRKEDGDAQKPKRKSHE